MPTGFELAFGRLLRAFRLGLRNSFLRQKSILLRTICFAVYQRGTALCCPHHPFPNHRVRGVFG
jgi:hypothetical protein